MIVQSALEGQRTVTSLTSYLYKVRVKLSCYPVILLSVVEKHHTAFCQLQIARYQPAEPQTPAMSRADNVTRVQVAWHCIYLYLPTKPKTKMGDDHDM